VTLSVAKLDANPTKATYSAQKKEQVRPSLSFSLLSFNIGWRFIVRISMQRTDGGGGFGGEWTGGGGGGGGEGGVAVRVLAGRTETGTLAVAHDTFVARALVMAGRSARAARAGPARKTVTGKRNQR